MVKIGDFSRMTLSEIQTYTLHQLQNCELDELRAIAIHQVELLPNERLKEYFLSFIAKIAVSTAAQASSEALQDSFCSVDFVKNILLDLISFLHSFLQSAD